MSDSGYIIDIDNLEKVLNALNSFDDWLEKNTTRRSLTTWNHNGNVCKLDSLRKKWKATI